MLVEKFTEVIAGFFIWGVIEGVRIDGSFWHELRLNESLEVFARDDASGIGWIDGFLSEVKTCGLEELTDEVNDIVGHKDGVTFLVDDVTLLGENVIVVF